MRLGIVAGLALEAHRLGLPDKTPTSEFLVASGAGEAAAAAAAKLLAAGAEALLSFGLAGALDPELEPGHLVVAVRVRTADGAGYDCNAAWRDQLASEARLIGIQTRVGSLLGTTAVVSEPEEKAALNLEHGTIAVDTESHHVAEAAAGAGRPFAALRVIVDAQQYRLPAAALAAYDADGRLRPSALAMEILRRPAELPAMLGLARRSRIALSSLGRIGRRGARLLPPV